MLTLTPTGQDTYLLIKAPSGTTPLGSVVIHNVKTEFICNPKNSFFTRDAKFKVISSKRCPNAGSCYDYPRCKSFTNEDIRELRGETEELPHHNFCKSSCACAGCGCFYCTAGCLFYRLYATKTSSKVYRVFECPSWFLQLHAVVSIQQHDQEEASTNIILTPGVPQHFENLTVTMGTIATPQLPVLSKPFVTDNEKTAIIHGTVTGQTMEEYISNFTCPGFTSAQDFKCQFSPSICKCLEADDSVSCTCPSREIQSIMQNDQYVLPITHEDFHLKMENNQLNKL